MKALTVQLLNKMTVSLSKIVAGTILLAGFCAFLLAPLIIGVVVYGSSTDVTHTLAIYNAAWLVTLAVIVIAWPAVPSKGAGRLDYP